MIGLTSALRDETAKRIQQKCRIDGVGVHSVVEKPLMRRLTVQDSLVELTDKVSEALQLQRNKCAAMKAMVSLDDESDVPAVKQEKLTAEEAKVKAPAGEKPTKKRLSSSPAAGIITPEHEPPRQSPSKKMPVLQIPEAQQDLINLVSDDDDDNAAPPRHQKPRFTWQEDEDDCAPPLRHGKPHPIFIGYLQYTQD